MSNSRRRDAANFWAPGKEAWVQFVDGTYKCELLERNEFGVWTVKWDNGDTDHTKVPEKKLLREPPAEEESGDEDADDDNAPAAGTPVRKKQRSGSAPTVDCGAPRDKRIAELFYQFLYFRATQRRLMYPGEEVVGANGPLPPAALPTASTTGRKLMAVAKWGNACRYLDSGDRVTGAFVRAKLEHLGLALGSPEGIAAALSMCVVEMDAWRVDFLRSWTAQTPGDWFRMAKGQMKGLNLPAGREEVKNFVSFARRVMRNEDGPFFSGSYQVQGRRLVDPRMRPEGKKAYYEERLKQIDSVVAELENAKTWEEAIMAVRLLGGAGPFVGGQALLTFLYGVCEGDVSRFAPSLDVGTMIDYCTYGGGPKRMVERLWRVPGESVRLREHEVVARISWLAKNAEAEFAQLGLAFPYQVKNGQRRTLTAVDMEHSLCYFSRYLAGYEGLKEAGAATVYRMLAGPVTNKECPRPSIKWIASLTPHTAADRCRKWLGGEEEDDESDPDE